MTIQAMSSKVKRQFPVGSQHPLARLTESDIPKIRRLLRDGVSGTEVAARFRVCTSVISVIKSGKSWSHVVDDDKREYPVTSSLTGPRCAIGEARSCIFCQKVKAADCFRTRHGRVCIECFRRRNCEWVKAKYRKDETYRTAMLRRSALRRLFKMKDIRAYLDAWTERNRDKARSYWRKYAKSNKGIERSARARAKMPYTFSMDATNHEGSWLGDNRYNPETVLINKASHSEMVVKLSQFKNDNPQEYARICRDLEIDDPLETE